MTKRILQNQASVCPTCKAIYPAFENMVPAPSIAAAAGGRRLLQSGAYYAGSTTVLFVYDANMKDAIVISYPDILASIYNANYTKSVLPLASNATGLERLIADLQNSNLLATNISTRTSMPIDIVVTKVLPPSLPLPL